MNNHMLSLLDVVTRRSPPIPWAEGDNIPWDEPGFSARMLEEHLSQDHDLASRRAERIAAQISTICALMSPPPGRVLDLACGPGLYLSHLADAGYSGVGIDFSPASIEYARTRAAAKDHDLELRLDDLRTAVFGSGYHAALFLYGQMNVFRRDEARSIITRAFDALAAGGVLIVEPQTYDHVKQSGQSPSHWSAHRHGLFSPDPHLLLTEGFWDEARRTATERFYVVDAATGDVTRHAMSNEAYTESELEDLLRTAGFGRVEHRASLSADDTTQGLSVVIGFKTA